MFWNVILKWIMYACFRLSTSLLLKLNIVSVFYLETRISPLLHELISSYWLCVGDGDYALGMFQNNSVLSNF